MKKVCVICFFIILMLGLYYYSYNWSLNFFANDGNDFVIKEVPTLVVDKSSEEIVSNKTDYIIETYNIDNQSITEEKLTIPVQFLGYKRADLIKAIKTYMENPSVTDKAQGMKSFELASFSSKKVVVRKSYSTKDLPQVYYICVENGYLTIYLEDKVTLYDYTNIILNNLSESLQIEIINGKKINSQKELYEFLETHTS